MRTILLTILFILSSNISFAHQDFWMTKDFGNVKVRIKTGFQYEEIKKSWIIGELAHKFCQEFKYSKPVFIDFNHFYVGDCDPDYFLSFDDGSIESGEKSKAIFDKNVLVIREVSRNFNPMTTLKLLEYAIRNLEKLKYNQKTIEYVQNYCQWKINTIDTLQIKDVVKSDASNVVNKILSTKIYRQEEEKNRENISYYFQDNKYHIYYDDYTVKESVLLVVENVYQFKKISFNEAIIFDTKNSFYFVQGVNNPHASEKKIIENIFRNYRPFEINKIGAYKVAFSFWDDGQERTVLYKCKTNELIQDLDKIIENK